MTNRIYASARKWETSDITDTGQARARTPATDIEILEFIAGELASTLSELSERFGLAEDLMRFRLETLISNGWLRVQGMVDSPAAVYSVTQDGAKKLERR